MPRLFFSLREAVSRIDVLAERLPVNGSKRGQISKQAREYAELYIKKLGAKEERFPMSIALGALFLSTHDLGVKLSEHEMNSVARCNVPNWAVVAKDMAERLQVATSFQV